MSLERDAAAMIHAAFIRADELIDLDRQQYGVTGGPAGVIPDDSWPLCMWIHPADGSPPWMMGGEWMRSTDLPSAVVVIELTATLENALDELNAQAGHFIQLAADWGAPFFTPGDTITINTWRSPRPIAQLAVRSAHPLRRDSLRGGSFREATPGIQVAMLRTPGQDSQRGLIAVMVPVGGPSFPSESIKNPAIQEDDE